MKRKIISLLCAVAALSVIMTFTGMQASAKTIAPDVKLNYTSYEYTGSPLGTALRYMMKTQISLPTTRIIPSSTTVKGSSPVHIR